MENYRSAGHGSATHSSFSEAVSYCVWSWQRTESDRGAEWAPRVAAWAGVVLHPVTASTRAGVAMPRRRKQTRRERANLVDLLVAGRDDARTVVQNRPGLYPHPPSPDGRHDTKPNPPSRSSDSVEGRRCCPPAHLQIAWPATPLPAPCLHTHPSSSCLLTVDCSTSLLQLPDKPTGGSTTTAALHQRNVTPTYLVPRNLSDTRRSPNFRLPARLPAHQSVGQSVIANKALMRE